MRNGFVFYASFQAAINYLEASDQLTMYRAIIDYGLSQKEPTLPTHLLPIWSLIVPQIDANFERYENGKKGGRKPLVTKEKTSGSLVNNHWLPTPKPKEKDKEKDKGSVSDNFKNELLADQVFVEKFMMVKNCEPSQVKKQVDEFETWLTVKNQTHATFAEYKNHFWNWVALRNVQQKPHWTHTVKSEDLRYFEQHGELPDGTTPY